MSYFSMMFLLLLFLGLFDLDALLALLALLISFELLASAIPVFILYFSIIEYNSGLICLKLMSFNVTH